MHIHSICQTTVTDNYSTFAGFGLAWFLSFSVSNTKENLLFPWLFTLNTLIKDVTFN